MDTFQRHADEIFLTPKDQMENHGCYVFRSRGWGLVSIISSILANVFPANLICICVQHLVCVIIPPSNTLDTRQTRPFHTLYLIIFNV